MRTLIDAFRAPTATFVRRLAIASLVANVGISLTGAVVRLTGSGLGCPTWPRCTDESFVPHGELGIHGVIEFGNRLLTYVLVVVAVATWVAVWRWRPVRPQARRLATAMALGIPAQAVIGGITVLTDLNPWIVAFHLLVSMALIAASTVLIVWTREPEVPVRPTIPAPARQLVHLTYTVLWVVLYLGTVVTGSGPHAGDVDSPRNGLDPAAMSQLHADAVFLLVGLTVGCLLVLRAVSAPPVAVRAAVILLVAELLQGGIGFVQYYSDLPILLVGSHVLGAGLLVFAATRLVLATRERVPALVPALDR